MERKSYSKRREENLRRLTTDFIYDLRITILHGFLYAYNAESQDNRLAHILADLPEKIATEYKRSLKEEQAHD